MEIDGFEVVEPFPALYWPRRDAVVLSDLHLGLESLLADSGVFAPKVQLDEILQDLQQILEEEQPAELIIVGDIKHEFSTASKGEKEEIRTLITQVTEHVETVSVVKGNHDNFVIYALEHQENVEMDTFFLFDQVLFIHGDEIPDTIRHRQDAYETVVIGHEHPAVAMEDDAGVTEKIHCFVTGSWHGNRLVVLPAFSPMARGNPVNRIPQGELASPFLHEADPDTLHAVGIDRDAGVLDFGRLQTLKTATFP
jgi:putative SbcD/Mre11-related phosphoesterase